MGAKAASHQKWVINKIRALGSWYTKGFENGSHLRTAINRADTLGELQDVIAAFFFANVTSPNDLVARVAANGAAPPGAEAVSRDRLFVG